MDTITLILTTRTWNPVSIAIRCVTRSPASHCIIVDGVYAIEASLSHFHVIRRSLSEALDGCKQIAVLSFEVPNVTAGLEFARAQVGKLYDLQGAFGIALAPDRDWQKPDRWECFELGAAAVQAAGRRLFADTGHVTGNDLLNAPLKM
jgi:hypothetical protein